MNDEASRHAVNPAQHQDEQPGLQVLMHPQPVSIRPGYRGSDRLKGRRALITGGDSGIGRAVALHFAREGADIAIVYLDETEDAHTTRELVQSEGRSCTLIALDLREEEYCRDAVQRAVAGLGGLDLLVNNVAEQHPQKKPENISRAQLQSTFQTNVFSYIHVTQAALEHLGEGSAIINTASVTGIGGHKTLIDYSATKGAILALTFSLAQNLAPRGIRVNAVAPGPIWTPLIPASFTAKQVSEFGHDTLLKRPGQPSEVAPAYVYLACDDASFVTGQILHVNGGSFIGA